MFNCNSLRSLFLGLALLTAACGTEPGPADAQDLSVQFHTDASHMKPRPQLPALPHRRFSAVDPARILVIGDSLAQGFGIFLDRRVAERNLAAVVINRGKTSTGLARSDFYDWPAEFAEAASDLRPDIVIAHFGTNDNQAINRPKGRAAQGTEAWTDAYHDQIRAILDIAARNNAVLYWLGPAPDRSGSLNGHMTRVNPIFRNEAGLSNAHYLPLSTFAAGENGEFIKTATINGKSVTIRSGDGSHFTGAGYYLVADKLLEDLASRVPSIFDAPQVELAGILQ